MTSLTIEDKIKEFIGKYMSVRPLARTHCSTVKDAFFNYTNGTIGKQRLYKAIENIHDDVCKSNGFFHNVEIRIVYTNSADEQEKYAQARLLHRMTCETEIEVQKIKANKEIEMIKLEIELTKQKNNLADKQIDILQRKKELALIEKNNQPKEVPIPVHIADDESDSDSDSDSEFGEEMGFTEEEYKTEKEPEDLEESHLKPIPVDKYEKEIVVDKYGNEWELEDDDEFPKPPIIRETEISNMEEFDDDEYDFDTDTPAARNASDVFKIIQHNIRNGLPTANIISDFNKNMQ